MKDWLTKLAEQEKTAEQALQETLESLSPDDIRELSYALGAPRSSYIDEMQEKIANAQRMGEELAYEHTKEANIINTVIGAGKGFLGGGVGGAIAGGAKAAISDGIQSGAMKGLKSMANPVSNGGGFSYAKNAGVNWGAAGQKVLGHLHNHPGTAITAAGMGVGALMAPRDPQTGQKQYLRGAMVGGGLAAGANALTQGQYADKVKNMVTRQNNPILGQGVRKSMITSAYNSSRSNAPQVFTRGGGAASAASSVPASASNAAASGLSEAAAASLPTATAVRGGEAVGKASEWDQGPVFSSARNVSAANSQMRRAPAQASGSWDLSDVTEKKAALRSLIEKMANRQTLIYDPATKTFTRQHMTPSAGGETMQQMGAAPIAAGHTEPVRAEGITHIGDAPYGSREFMQARMRQAGMRPAAAPVAAIHGTTSPTMATGANRAAGPVSMGARVPPPVPKPLPRPALGGLASAMAKKAGFKQVAKKAIGGAKNFGMGAVNATVHSAMRPVASVADAVADRDINAVGYALGSVALPAAAYAVGKHRGKKAQDK